MSELKTHAHSCAPGATGTAGAAGGAIGDREQLGPVQEVGCFAGGIGEGVGMSALGAGVSAVSTT